MTRFNFYLIWREAAEIHLIKSRLLEKNITV